MIKSSKKTRTRVRIEKQLDALIRERVFERDGWACVRCGATKALTPSHVYPRGTFKNMRWLDINILTMDWACHRFWWHNNPCESAEWFQKTYPERYRKLVMLKDTLPKQNAKDLLAELERE